MMTKAAEREVLAQIAELIESTDADSYIRTAFTGCVRDAEANIDDDAAYSWYDRAQSAARNAEAAEKKAGEARRELALAKETMQQEAARADKFVQLYQQSKAERDRIAVEAADSAAKIEELELTIMQLKAQLYDFMIRA